MHTAPKARRPHVRVPYFHLVLGLFTLHVFELSLPIEASAASPRSPRIDRAEPLLVSEMYDVEAKHG